MADGSIYVPRAPELVKAWERDPARVLVADPTWQAKDKLPGPKRGAAKIYKSELTLEQIKAYPLPPLADDAVLVLWRVAWAVQEALDVVKAWGFIAKSELVWVKTAGPALHGSVRLRMGMGRQTRMAHEVAIIATRGRSIRQSMSELSVVFAPRRAHSQKPEEAYDLLERLYPGPYTELFARRRRPMWRCEGNEL
jgi:N6-adenosine-specific RNA methylase IME4